MGEEDWGWIFGKLKSLVGRWREVIGNEMLTDYERRLISFFWNGVERDMKDIRGMRRLKGKRGKVFSKREIERKTEGRFLARKKLREKQWDGRGGGESEWERD